MKDNIKGYLWCMLGAISTLILFVWSDSHIHQFIRIIAFPLSALGWIMAGRYSYIIEQK